MVLTYNVKKIGGSLYKFLKRINDKLYYWDLTTQPNVNISKHCFISSTSKVKIILGGSITIDDYTEILDGVLILTYGGNIKIGKRCNINPYTIIYGHGNTSIGDNVLIAGGCMIIPSNHNFANLEMNINDQGSTSMGIRIENNVWIGHGCSILDNVIIGQGSIVAAGSVVNKSIPPFSIVAGVPAKVIKKRNE
jgi:acetyltransferase-like isoleucine patch superfamily enzyme